MLTLADFIPDAVRYNDLLSALNRKATVPLLDTKSTPDPEYCCPYNRNEPEYNKNPPGCVPADADVDPRYSRVIITE